MIESVIDEMCASLTEVPPMSSGVVAVNSPASSWCLMNEVRLMTNSRKLLIEATRSTPGSSSGLARSEPTRADASGGGESPLPSRSPPSPHPTQNESPARQAVVLFGKNLKILSPRMDIRWVEKMASERGDPFQEFAKLDHPVSRDIAGKKSGGQGAFQAVMHANNHKRGQGRSRTGNDRPRPVHRAGRGWLLLASCAQLNPSVLCSSAGARRPWP